MDSVLEALSYNASLYLATAVSDGVYDATQQ
jgi:hypothetical protein